MMNRVGKLQESLINIEYNSNAEFILILMLNNVYPSLYTHVSKVSIGLSFMLN